MLTAGIHWYSLWLTADLQWYPLIIVNVYCISEGTTIHSHKYAVYYIVLHCVSVVSTDSQ